MPFEDATTPIAIVDVGELYAGREELLDPRAVLPSWHRHARGEAAKVFEATRAGAGDAKAFATAHWKELHVLELAESGANSDEARTLAVLAHVRRRSRVRRHSHPASGGDRKALPCGALTTPRREDEKPLAAAVRSSGAAPAGTSSS